MLVAIKSKNTQLGQIETGYDCIRTCNMCIKYATCNAAASNVFSEKILQTMQAAHLIANIGIKTEIKHSFNSCFVTLTL